MGKINTLKIGLDLTLLNLKSDEEAIVIKITKLSESENPLYPNNIEEGYTKNIMMVKENFLEPTVGSRFNLVGIDANSRKPIYFSTSDIQEILTENTFRTYNSIYKWEILKNKN